MKGCTKYVGSNFGLSRVSLNVEPEIFGVSIYKEKVKIITFAYKIILIYKKGVRFYFV